MITNVSTIGMHFELLFSDTPRGHPVSSGTQCLRTEDIIKEPNGGDSTEK